MQKTHILLAVLLPLFLLGFWQPSQAERSNSLTIVELTTPIHFLAPDASDLVVEPGTYSVEAAEKWLRLISGERRDALLLEAHASKHEELIEQPVSFLTSKNDHDTYHLVLLLPNGQQFESVGTVTGIRARGTPHFLNATQLKTSIQKAKIQPKHLAGKKQPLQIRVPRQSTLSATNACLRNVRAEFLKIRTHGDKLGFHHTQTPGSYGQASHSHYQGVQRFGNYLAVTGSSSQAGEVLIVELGSRPTSGKFRSNRISSNVPPANDRTVKVIQVSQRLSHAGGLQVAGKVLAVGVEGHGQSEVVFYSIENPKNPRELYRIARTQPAGGFNDPPSAGATALEKRQDGRFLLIVGRADSNVLDIYLSRNGNISTNTFELVDSWHERELQGMDQEFGNYQNINLIRQCDGQLFFVGLHKNIKIGGVVRGGQDWADLFKIEVLPASQSGQSQTTSAQTVITKVANRHVYCRDMCDFDAGAGTYVHPTQGLSIYGIEHWRHHGLVRLNEFRSVPTSYSPRLTKLNQAWIELYDDHSYGDRSVIIDYIDRQLRNYKNYDRVEGFEDKTSSIKWAIPRGWQYLLFEDKNFKGRKLALNGTGTVNAIPHLGSRAWNDKVSSSRFSPETITHLNQAWVELFDDHTFKDRRLKVTGTSGPIKNYKKINVEGRRGFGDKASSARYMIPRGHAYRLYEHDSYKGKILDLIGTGKIEEIVDFNRRRFNDKVSSSQFVRK